MEYKKEKINLIKNGIIKFIREWFDENGPTCNAIIGISGGKDSTICGKLLVEALGKDRVIGVQMPNGIQSDIEDSDKVIDYLGIKSYKINIQDMVDAFKNNLSNSEITMTEQAKINLPARVRMTTLYAVAQCFNGRVCNTCNRSEDFVGYATLYGDVAGDFSLLQDLKVCEVKALGYELGIPKEFIEKTPSDGLCGKSDEDNLGFTYNDIDKFIYQYDDEVASYDDPDERVDFDIPEDIYDKINEKKIANRFKTHICNIPTYFRPFSMERTMLVNLT